MFKKFFADAIEANRLKTGIRLDWNIKKVEGVQVIHSDVSVYQFTRLLPRHIGVMMLLLNNGDYAIVVNQGFLNAPKDIQDTFYQHELGHMVLKHHEQTGGQSIWKRMFTKAYDRIEFEADQYAQDKGYDMIGALKFLRDTQPEMNRKELNRRIKHLQGVTL